MKVVTKQLTYKDFDFKMELKLKTRAEKRIDGDFWHTLRIYGENNKYNFVAEIKDCDIESSVKKLETLTKEWVDKEIQDQPVDQSILDLGFS